MRPMSLDDLGLVPAVRQLVKKLSDRKILNAELKVDGQERVLDKHVEVTLFRIIQESLNNIHRHAGVEEGYVRMLFAPDHLAILIEDHGNGFDQERLLEERKNPDGDGHFGMIGMEERAKIIGANLTVASEPGNGTRVHVKLSYPGGVNKDKA